MHFYPPDVKFGFAPFSAMIKGPTRSVSLMPTLPVWVIASDFSRCCAKLDRQLILRFIIRLMRVTLHSDVQLHFTAVQTAVNMASTVAHVCITAHETKNK